MRGICAKLRSALLVECIGSFVFFALAFSIISLASQRMQLVPSTADVHYPIFLGGGPGVGVICFANDITNCSAAQLPCCGKSEVWIGQVSMTTLLLVSVGIPLLCIMGHTVMARYLQVGQTTDLKAMLGYFCCMASTECITTYFKVHIGRPRPNHLALVALSKQNTGLAYLFEEAWKSCPSGHSSSSMAGCAYLSLWLLGLLHKYTRGAGRNKYQDLKGQENSDPLLPARSQSLLTTLMYPPFYSLCSCLCATPIILAFWVASTRVEDYWHHASDVIAGDLIGACCAYWAFNWVYKGPRNATFGPHPVGNSMQDSSPTDDHYESTGTRK